MDAAEQLKIHALVEDPERWEAMIRREIELSRTDPAARAVIESIYCEEDREAAFERFRSSLELTRIIKLLEVSGVRRDARICEIGGGGGWLGWALHHAGYRHLEMLEPNAGFITGTGYLRTRPDARDIRIWNDLDAWYGDPGLFDVILTHNCCHHFRGLSFVAAAIRQKVAPGGRWVMLREWFADSPEELYRQLTHHPYSQKYGVFEFPYPASHYVESLEIAGFTLEAVIPARYANGVLDSYVQREGGVLNRAGTRAVDAVLAKAPALTAGVYRSELFANRYLGRKLRYFTRPQGLVFSRREVD